MIRDTYWNAFFTIKLIGKVFIYSVGPYRNSIKNSYAKLKYVSFITTPNAYLHPFHTGTDVEKGNYLDLYYILLTFLEKLFYCQIVL